MSDNENKPARPARGLFFYFKVLAVFVCLMVLSAGVAVYYVYHRLTTDSQLEKMVMEKVSSAINMDVKFASLAVVFPGIEISNVTVATDTPEMKLDARIAQIKIRPDLMAAFGGELLIDALTVASAATDVELKKTVSKPGTVAAPTAGPGLDLASIKFPFNSVDLNGLRFSINDQNSGQAHELIVNSAGLNRSMLSTSVPFNVDAVLTGRAKLSVEGKIYWPANVVADLTVKSENIDELKKLIPEKYRKHADFLKGVEIKAAIKYNVGDGSLGVETCQVKAEPGFQADGKFMVARFSPLDAEANFKVTPMEVNDLWPMAKSFVPAEHGLTLNGGRISTAVDVVLAEGAIKKLAVTVTPEKIEVKAKALPEKVNLDRGHISYDDGKINFSEFEARMADTLLKMPSGTLVADPVAFNGEVAAEVNLESIYKLVSGQLTAEQKRIIPAGKAAFSGKLAYDAKGFRVDGTLNSEQIKVKEQKTSAQATIERLRVHFDSIGPSAGVIKIESLEVNGVGASVKISGNIKNAKDLGFDLAAAGNLKVDEFSRLGAGLFKIPVREGQFKGDLSLDMKVGGSVSDPKPKGRIEFRNVHADFSDRGLIVDGLNGAAAADIDNLELENLSAELLGGKLSISGSLKNFKKPVADAKATVSGADLAAIRKFLKVNFREMSDELDFAGNADLNVSLTGPAAAPTLKGDAVLKACRFSHPAVLRPLENIGGPIGFSNAGLDTTGLAASWGSSKVMVTGSMKNWAKFITDFRFVVDPLDVTDAGSFFLKDTGYKIDGRGTGAGSISGEVAKIKVEGVASVPSGIFSAPVSEKGDVFKFPFKSLQAKAVYYEKQVNVSSATMELFSGKVSASGKVFLDKEPIVFEFDTRIDDLMTEQFLAENTSYKDILQGGIDGTFTAGGNTAGLVSMNGKASLAMQKGFYNSPPFVKQLSQQLGTPQLASGPIENVAGDYLISGGRISSKNTVGKSKAGKVTFVGSVGLDATLDGEAQIQIKREICQQSDVLRQLVGNAETLDIPVTLKGSFMSPSVGLPLDRMLRDVAERRAKETVQKEAEKALGKIFGIKTGDSQTQTASAATTVPAGNVQVPPPDTTTQTATATQQTPPPTPQKKIENKIKEVGKELKNLGKIFKF